MATLSTDYNVQLSGDTKVDILMSGAKWSSTAITYSFRTTAPTAAEVADYGDNYALNFAELSAIQKAAVREILNKWASVSGLTFSEVTEPSATGVLRFGTCSSTVVPTSEAYYPSSGEVGGDVWFGNSNSNAPDNPLSGSYDYHAVIHEIGHALGLKHPHGSAWFGSFPIAEASMDAMENTAMSYKSYVGSTENYYVNGNGSYSYSPMAYDIAAVQYLYGANYNYHSGNNVYSFSPTQGKIFETIWDGGGIDTYNLSAYLTGVEVDLNPGEWSTFNPSQLAELNWNNSLDVPPGSVCNAYLFNGDARSLIENALGGSGNDTLTGNSGNNSLTGNAGNDRLYGNAGNDRLSGNANNDLLSGGTGNDALDAGAGNDTMQGGAGNDSYVVDAVGDVLTEAVSAGTDTVSSTLNWILGNNFEHLTLTGSAHVNGTGNTLGNVLRGNSGRNSLSGLAGNDVLNGGAGNDTLLGGAGNDSYYADTGDVLTEAAADGTDTIFSALTWTLGNNFECLTLTGSVNVNGTGNTLNNALRGNSGRNSLFGLTGNDSLYGYEGNDLLDGGVGNDAMQGGAGNDSYVVNSVGDILTEAVSSGTDTVSSLVTRTLGSNFEQLTLTGSTNVNGTGNTLDNVLRGNSGRNSLSGLAGNDVLNGGAGNDTMQGGAGNDSYYVDAGGDVVTEADAAGTDILFSTVTRTLGSYCENLTLTGSTAINGTGNVLNNVLTGNGGRNILSGLAGNDRLNGGLGNDSLQGGAGNDVYLFTGNFGHDWIVADGTNSNVQDSVQFLGINHTLVAGLVSGNNLVLSYGSGNDVTLQDWNVSAAYKLNVFQFTDGRYNFNGVGWSSV